MEYRRVQGRREVAVEGSLLERSTICGPIGRGFFSVFCLLQKGAERRTKGRRRRIWREKAAGHDTCRYIFQKVQKAGAVVGPRLRSRSWLRSALIFVWFRRYARPRPSLDPAKHSNCMLHAATLVHFFSVCLCGSRISQPKPRILVWVRVHLARSLSLSYRCARGSGNSGRVVLLARSFASCRGLRRRRRRRHRRRSVFAVGGGGGLCRRRCGHGCFGRDGGGGCCGVGGGRRRGS